MKLFDLIPIQEELKDNQDFLHHPDCQEALPMTITYYKSIGYKIPWIGYFVSNGKELVGSAGFKGKPVNNRIEIAYGTFDRFQHQGIGTEICKLLVQLSLRTDPLVRICARTFEKDNYSSKVLINNGFVSMGTVMDEDDGEVWEWEYRPANTVMRVPKPSAQKVK